MNSRQISHLKRLLKKYGVKNASTIVADYIHCNYEQFLTRAEPLYVLDRIKGCYENGSHQARLEQAHREWMAMVIDNGCVTSSHLISNSMVPKSP